jgi:YVTN family beta-propeller protein
MNHKKLLWAVAAPLLLATVAHAQQYSHDISLTGLGNGSPGKPFGIAYEPTQDLIYVPLAGVGGWPGAPNNVVAVIDPLTDSVVQTIPCGLYPEVVAFSYDSSGQLQFGAVTNSTDGSVSIWDASLNVMATVVLPDPFGFGTSYPYGIAASEDGRKLWVSTVDGSGEIYAIDLTTMALDPAAGFTTPFASGSKLLASDGKLFAGTTRYNATWTDSEAGLVVIDIASGQITETLITAEGSGSFPGTQDLQLLADGRIAASGLFFDGYTYVFSADGILDRTFSQDSGAGAHGLALSPAGDVLVCCDLPSNKVVFLDLQNHVQIASINLASVGLGYSQPNDAVFAHGKLYVTSQGTEEVVVFDQLPDPAPGPGYYGELVVDNATPLPGETITATVTGSGTVALASAREGLASTFQGNTLEIGPSAVLQGTGIGVFSKQATIPNLPSMRGLHIWLQGGVSVNLTTELTAPKVIIVQ